MDRILSILASDKTEKEISTQVITVIDEEIMQPRSNRSDENEPSLPSIFPTCEDGSFLKCEENRSNAMSEDQCKGVLIFMNETSYCFCSNKQERKQHLGPILRQGWSHYTRFFRFLLYLTLEINIFQLINIFFIALTIVIILVITKIIFEISMKLMK